MPAPVGRCADAIATALGAALLVAACQGSGGTRDEELGGLVTAPAARSAPIDVGRAGRDAAELGRALAQPWAVAAAKLGDHTLTVHHTLEVREGVTVLETLGETTTVIAGKNGSYHATYENTADYGREVIYLPPGTLYLRPRYARWHRRAPETPDEPATTRDQLAGVLGADYDLIAHAVEVSDQGAATAAGRAGHRLEIELAPSPRPAPKPTQTQQAWRDGATVEQARGEVVLDDQTGAALTAQLDASVTFVREGRRLTMRMVLTQTLAVEPVADLAAPADDAVVATPERSREVDDRNLLLQGIAPPIGKAAPAAAATPPAPDASKP